MKTIYKLCITFILFLPAFSFASSSYQLNSFATMEYKNGSQQAAAIAYQPLGNNISGNPSSIYFAFDQFGNGASNTITFSLQECNDSSYTTCVTYVNNGATFTYPTVFGAPVGTIQTRQLSFNSTSTPMNPNKFYRLHIAKSVLMYLYGHSDIGSNSFSPLIGYSASSTGTMKQMYYEFITDGTPSFVDTVGSVTQLQSRVISTSPGNGTSTASSTSKSISSQYYFSSADQANIFGTSKFEYTIQHIEASGVFGAKQTFTHEVPFFDGIVTQPDISDIVINPGSYVISIRLFNDYIGSLDYDIVNYATNFYVATRTQADLSQLETNLGIIESAFGSIQCEIDFPWGKDDFYCMTQYFFSVFVPPAETLQTAVKSTIDVFLYLPPWGYVTQLYISLQNPATSSATSLSYTIPEELPSSGLTIDLSVSDGVTKFNDVLNIESQSYDGTYGEQFLYYWNLMWSLIFAFWLLTSVLTVFKFNSDSPKDMGNRHTLDLKGYDPNMKGGKGTINMRK